MSEKNKERKKRIIVFILENEPCTFGQIKEYFSKTKFYANVSNANNKPLARDLKELIENDKKIQRNPESKPYPTYSVVKDIQIDSAIMGELFRYQFGNHTLGWLPGINNPSWFEDANCQQNDSFEMKFVKIMITRYGFFLMSMLLKSFEYTVNNKKFDRHMWISHAMDILEDEDHISTSFKSLLLHDGMTNLKNIDEKKVLKKKLTELKSTMEKLYPKLYQRLESYENSVVKKKKLSLQKNTDHARYYRTNREVKSLKN